jgi:TPR repeat protein
MQAANWYLKAAGKGNVWAQSRLGEMYAEGLGVPQDYVQAHLWFNLAASQSEITPNREAKARDDLAAKMTPAQIAEAQRMAREWKPTK